MVPAGPTCDDRVDTKGVTGIASAQSATAPGREPLLRRAEGRVVAGVAVGVARHLRVRPLLVRVAFAVLTLAGGAGVVAYAGLWMFVRQESPRPDVPPAPASTTDRIQAVAVIAVVLGLGILLGSAGLLPSSDVVLPLLVAAIGVAVVWRQADDSQRARWVGRSSLAATRLTAFSLATGRAGLLRLAGGVALVIGGVTLFLTLSAGISAARDALIATLAVLAGVGLITAPWWRRMVTELAEERRERIRGEERAEVAAHLHDSVLQTLALIQRNVDSPREVGRLARGQERELRAWLYGRSDDAGRFATALEGVAAEIEDDYGVSVEVVVVADCPLDDRLRGLVHACRECLVNAAKHASVGEVSLYAEVEPAEVSVFVRDRGRGFDPSTVDDDRHGLRESVRGRMRRFGGTVTIRTELGGGTEVELTMPRRTESDEAEESISE